MPVARRAGCSKFNSQTIDYPSINHSMIMDGRISVSQPRRALVPAHTVTGWLGKAERRRERECKRGWLRWRTRGASKDAIRLGRPDRSQNQVYERVQRLRSIPVFVGPSRRKSWAERLEIGISAPFELDARLWRRATRNSFWRPSV